MPKGARGPNGAVDRQASFEDVDLMTLPGVTEETIQDLSRDAREYFRLKEAIGESVKKMRSLHKGIMSVVPKDVDTATRYRIADAGVVECQPGEREPYEVKRAKITRRRLKPVEG